MKVCHEKFVLKIGFSPTAIQSSGLLLTVLTDCSSQILAKMMLLGGSPRGNKS